MSDSAARRLAIAGWIVTIALTLGAFAIRVASGFPQVPSRFGMADMGIGAISLLQVTSATVAVLILARLSRNIIGRLLLLTGVSSAVSIAAAAVTAATAGWSDLAAAEWGGWFGLTASTVSIAAFAPIGLLFPDGRPASPRWQRIHLGVLVLIAVVCAVVFLQPGQNTLIPSLRNPLGIGPDVSGLLGPAALAITPTAVALVAGLIGASMIERFRRSRGIERLQLKWFVAAVLLALAFLLVMFSIGYLSTGSVPAEWPLVVFALAWTAVPIAIGFAILRYRLYDIDRLVNRAIVYGSLTAILAGVFAAAATLAQRVMVAITGESSDAAIVLTTLVVATLYAPLRARLERVVERHFKYDHGRFGVYLQELNQVLGLLDPVRAAQRLAAEAVRELEAIGGAVVDPNDVPTATAGEWPVPAVVRLAIPGGHGPLEAILVGPRRDREPHDPRAIADLEVLARLATTAVWLHADRNQEVQGTSEAGRPTAAD
jgi:hypothetical protein